MENWIDRSSVSTRSSPGIGASVTVSLPGIERLPGATSRDISPPVPLSMIVVLQLESGDALAVDVGLADDAASGLAAGHLPPVLPIDVDTGQLEARDLVTERRVDLARDVDEPALLAVDLGQQVGDLVVGQVEEVVECLDRGGAVVDELRVDRDGGGGNGDRHLVAVAVEDRAALRGHVPRAGPLRRALRTVGIGFGGLQGRDAGDHDQQEHAMTTSAAISRKRGEPARRGVRLRGGGAWTRTRLRGGCLRVFDREPALAGCRVAA